jgi:FUS-interacting serine-arginine-rich protein 1
VQFLEPREAAEAQYCLDHQIIAGREITVVFAEENRKKPQEMRSKERIRYLILMSDSVGLME